MEYEQEAEQRDLEKNEESQTKEAFMLAKLFHLAKNSAHKKHIISILFLFDRFIRTKQLQRFLRYISVNSLQHIILELYLKKNPQLLRHKRFFFF